MKEPKGPLFGSDKFESRGKSSTVKIFEQDFNLTVNGLALATA